MTRTLSRRFVLGALAAFAPAAALANAPATSLRPRARSKTTIKQALGSADSVIAKSGLSGQVAFTVANVETGKQLETVQGKAGLPPASVTKALTALYALEHLGAEHRFRTQIVMTGTVQNGILTGDLILRGGGDPFLDTDGLADLAQATKAAGVREVRGRFLVYAGDVPYVRSIDPGQPDQLGYSPAVDGLALNFNRVHFEWKRQGNGYAVTMQARTKRLRPAVSSARMQIVNRKAPVYKYNDNGGVDTWSVARSALGNNGARWLPVRYPATYAADVFRTLARNQGLVLPAPKSTRSAPQGAQAIAQHSSPPLRVILQQMLKFSNNLTAEMVGVAATAARGKRPGNLKASAREMSAWASQRFGMRNTSLVDHSGLGDASRMTADDLVAALVQVRRRGQLRALLKPVTVQDNTGKAIRNASLKVDAKTGTLNFVAGLGGYVTTSNGTELAFAIFAADTKRRAGISRAERARAQGAKSWNTRAKRLQQSLLRRWDKLYGS